MEDFIENNLQKNIKSVIIELVRCFCGLYSILIYNIIYFLSSFLYAIHKTPCCCRHFHFLVFLVSAADVAAGTTTVASTGVTAGSVVVPTTTSATSLEMKGAPRLIKKTSDSVTLEWDAVPSASAYIVKYSKTSVANSTDLNAQYDNETGIITATGVVITKLSSSNEKLAPATSYYFSVVAIDKEERNQILSLMSLWLLLRLLDLLFLLLLDLLFLQQLQLLPLRTS